MKFLMISTLFTIVIASSFRPSYKEKEMTTFPIILDNVENTFHPYFDEKPIECEKFSVKLAPLTKFDKTWLKEHGGELLIIDKKNMIIKSDKKKYIPNKIYDVVEFQELEIYNDDTLVFKTDYINFKNMMSYADNVYSFNIIPFVFAFYDCS